MTNDETKKGEIASMKRAQALKILRPIIERHIRNNFAFNANLYAKGHITPMTEKDHLKRKKILDALETLETPEQMTLPLNGR